MKYTKQERIAKCQRLLDSCDRRIAKLEEALRLTRSVRLTAERELEVAITLESQTQKTIQE